MKLQSKIEWARRSVARLEAAIDANDDMDVEDHFLSFVHALSLIRSYLDEHCERHSIPASTLEKIISQWRVNCLTTSEQRIWDALTGLNTKDVRVQAVRFDAPLNSRILKLDEKDHVLFGRFPLTESPCYLVGHAGTAYRVRQIASDGLPLLDRFATDIHGMLP